jgi:ATPase subunit of ABC transporter with duplicated ATPase domains
LRKVLDNVHLSFYPDAKIGVLGLNGSGKSTLLRSWPASTRIGPARPGSPRARASATCRRSRSSIPKRSTCARTSWKASPRRKKAILDRYNELMMNYSDETADEMTKLQDEIDSQNLWDLDSRSRGDGRAALPAGRRRRRQALGRRARRVALCRCCWSSPTCCCSTSRPTISTPRPCLAGRHLREYPGAVLIVTHDRYFLDNVTGWILELDRGRGIPYEGNYSAWLGAEGQAPRAGRPRGRARQKTLEREREWIAPRPRRAGQVQGPYQAPMTNWSQKSRDKRRTPRRSSFRSPSGSATTSSTSRASTKGFGDRLLIDNLTFKLPPGGIVGVIGPNGAARPRCSA